jgi:hypothetical protein
MGRIVRYALAVAILALASASAQAACPPGYLVLPDNKCGPPGAQPCSTVSTGFCPQGAICGPGGCEEGTLKRTGPLCPGSSIRCWAGRLCTPSGSCYDPRYFYLCGSSVCGKTIKYVTGDSCFSCQQARAKAAPTVAGTPPPARPAASPPPRDTSPRTMSETAGGDAAPAGADCARAETHWKSAEEIKSADVYQDHLNRFPNCEFANLARARIRSLRK